MYCNRKYDRQFCRIYKENAIRNVEEQVMKITAIFVDEVPNNCGECILMKYIYDRPQCCALPDEKDNIKNYNNIEGNPIDMRYRRSDCPLSIYER